MKFKNYKAGYIYDTIAKVINDFRVDKDNESNVHKINGLPEYLSAFDLFFPNETSAMWQLRKAIKANDEGSTTIAQNKLLDLKISTKTIKEKVGKHYFGICNFLPYSIF